MLAVTLPGGMLLGALVFAPWFWGCTWPLGIHLLEILLLSATACWLAGTLMRGEGIRLPASLILSVSGLLLLGWMMALNAHSTCDENTGLFSPLRGAVSWLPGSVDQFRTREEMVRISGLLGAAVVTAGLGRERLWRRRIVGTMTATGASIALLGCWQRWSGATDIFWSRGRHLDVFFATFRNVTNAGEYLNFVLPLSAAWTLWAIVRRSRYLPLAVATMILLATGCVVGGSKMAPLVTGVSGGLFLLLQRRDLRAWAEGSPGKPLALTSVIVGLVLGTMVLSAGAETTWGRWGHWLDEPGGGSTLRHRLMVDRVCASALPDAGACGFGPGTFPAIFPYYSNMGGDDLSGYWTYAHDDFAQTAVEWGWLGGSLWAVYFVGGLIFLGGGWRRHEWRTEDRILAGGLVQALLIMAGMALIDFPLQIASIQLDVAAGLGLAWSSGSWPRTVEGWPSGGGESGHQGAKISLREHAQSLHSRLVR